MASEIRIGMSVYWVSVVRDEYGMHVALWTQRDEQRETRGCSSKLGALDEAKRVARAIDAAPETVSP